MGIDKWDTRFLELAQFWANTCSRDPSTKVGAVIADGKRVVSMGFNGFPAGVEDSDDRYQNRDIKYKFIVHGEMNALTFAKEPLDGFTLYTWPFMPCSTCAGIVIQAGIKRVVAPVNKNPLWVESFNFSRTLFSEAGVELIECEI